MINLIDSIIKYNKIQLQNTIKGTRINVPCGIKWEKNHLRKKIYIIIEIHKEKEKKNPWT